MTRRPRSLASASRMAGTISPGPDATRGTVSEG